MSDLSSSNSNLAYSTPNAAGSAPHSVSLKVMRLSAPAFVQTHGCPSFGPDSTHPPPPNPTHILATAQIPAGLSAQQLSSVWIDAAKSDMTTLGSYAQDPAQPSELASVRDFALSDLLVLPASFGTIYLGETFSSYLCINNESKAAVQDVGIKAELQTGTQRFTLIDTLQPSGLASLTGSGQDTPPTRVSLLPSQNTEYIIHHEIKELGIHILVCSVHYTAGIERKFFRKFFKFQVMNPLGVKTKVNTLQDGRLFLEAQVQNISSSSMYLERMRFEPADQFNFQDLNGIYRLASDGHPAAPESGSATTDKGSPPSSSSAILRSLDPRLAIPSQHIFGDGTYLAPQDSRQYLFMLGPKKERDAQARATPGLGKLDIFWCTLFGQTGRLQTSQLSRKAPVLEPFEIYATSITTGPVVAERPFVLACRISSNTSTETLNISVSGVKSRMSSVLLRGPSELTLGPLAPLQTIDFELEFFPLLTGLHKITGLRINELNSGTSHDVESIADIFVCPLVSV
ncbi:uncharacterized protein BJ171DRAFT_472990 [Polychytrium aggregatum]|uniref:uncharacterized protein n=1 Tax=Polychytrium aggregatum TaxID=110093 RepID=UPI0022FE435E|nr:uncharacterized protein BJ171DRAFT_472990 [Polychytrium aggregatum]KAI9207019.1 hypothetical protein BJ171DRAFT_472990 [Polychytrium aggregatum]